MYIVFACYVQRSRDTSGHVQGNRVYALREGDEILAFATSAYPKQRQRYQSALPGLGVVGGSPKPETELITLAMRNATVL